MLSQRRRPGNFSGCQGVGPGVSMIDEDLARERVVVPLGPRPLSNGDVRDAVPTTAVGEILALADELARIGSAGTQLARRIESVTGLRAGEVQVLAAVDAGSVHPRGIAEVIGQVVEAAEATVSALVERGLLGRHAHASDPAGDLALVHLTPSGRAVLEQVEAVQIRLADALASTLGAEQTRTLRSTLATVADVLDRPARPLD